MTTRRDIFEKRRLTPNQLRQVAERRFGDAKCLLESGDPQRANGAIYMAGFVIECLLKALLIRRHPNLGKPVDPARLSKSDKEVYGLLYSHNLSDMLGFLPEVERKLERIRTISGRLAWPELRTICEEWTVYARYSPHPAGRQHAASYLEAIKEIKRCLQQI